MPNTVYQHDNEEIIYNAIHLFSKNRYRGKPKFSVHMNIREPGGKIKTSHMSTPEAGSQLKSLT